VDLTGVEWRKSSFSGGNSDNAGCIEVGFMPDGNYAIRDSTKPEQRPHVFTTYEWECFVAGVHNGEFDLPQE
jgi:hypothetical protein